MQWHSSRIHFNPINDTFREWNSRRQPWGTFVYSSSAVVEIWIPGVQAKFWNPESLCSIPRRCPSFHGLPSLAGDSRQGASPLDSALSTFCGRIFWETGLTCLTNIFPSFVSPEHWHMGNNPIPAAEGQIKLKRPLTSPVYTAVISQSVCKRSHDSWEAVFQPHFVLEKPPLKNVDVKDIQHPVLLSLSWKNGLRKYC